MTSLCPLLLAVVLEPLRVSATEPTNIDGEAAVQGVHVRVGSLANDWTVRVVGTDADAETATVELAPPAGAQSFRRTVALHAGDAETRGRELASSVAVILENYVEPEPEPAPESKPNPPPVERPTFDQHGYVALDGSVAFGPHAAPATSGGVGLRVGGWLASAHVHPRLHVGWVAARRSGLALDGVEIEAGAAFGGELLDAKLWLGAGPFADALGVRAKATGVAAAWAGRVHIPLIAVYRPHPWVCLGAEVGPTLQFPPLRFLSDDASLRWRTLRVRAVLAVGVIFR